MKSPGEYRSSQEGAVAVIVGICLFMLFGFAVLAVDVGHLYVARNELKNAADSGALAGARVLINDDNTVNTGANLLAKQAALENLADRNVVEVDYASGNDPTKDVVRGHWSFTQQVFTPLNTTGPYDFIGKGFSELDDPSDPNFYPFVNSIKVITRRDNVPVSAYLAQIFGWTGFNFSSNESIAYIGWTKDIGPYEIDAPIIMCEEALLIDGVYQCTVGRMFSDSTSSGHAETAAWTDFNQPSCSGASKTEVASFLPCTLGEVNTDGLSFGDAMESSNGVTASNYATLKNCWETALQDHDGDNDTPNIFLDSDGINGPDIIFELTLPVATCDTHPCYPLVGAVTMRLLWMLNQANDNPLSESGFGEVPVKMDNWTCSVAATVPNRDDMMTVQRQTCWNEFVSHFNLKKLDEGGNLVPATFFQKTMYFLPSCTPQDPRGTTGGRPYGILAEIPVLVK